MIASTPTDTHTIYLDHAATTPLDPRVLEAMLPFYTTASGNASSIYALGRSARDAIDHARDTTATAIGALSSEIVFTSGGSESDNAAIKGAYMARLADGNHVITGATEHHAVLHSVEWLRHLGAEITILPVDSYGRVDPHDVERAIRPTTTLISLMLANNEVGTYHPIADIAQITRHHNVTLHTDAVQAIGLLPINVADLGVDLLSLSAHKFYGPKGSGALYVKRGTPWLSQQVGGGQERGRRAGTENTPAIVGLATALQLAVDSLETRVAHVSALRNALYSGLLQALPHTRLNGHPTDRLPNNLNLSFPGVDGESLILNLDMHHVAASTGSACTAGSLDPSHVLLALGLTTDQANSSLRLTLGKDTTTADIDRLIQILPSTIAKLSSVTAVL